jgi:hypothetical protein
MRGYKLTVAIKFLLTMKNAMAQNSNGFPFQRTADYEDLFMANASARTTTDGYSVTATQLVSYKTAANTTFGITK